jgi:hypothetical protein
MSASDQIRKVKNKFSGRIKILQRKVAIEIAQAIIEVVRLRTRQEGQGSKGPLKKLEKSTVSYRERYKDNLSSDTDPSKSNLTATGQLLDSLQFKVANGKITVTVNNKRRKPGLSGGKTKSTNDEVRKHLEDISKDFEFLKLSDDELQEVTELTRQLLEDGLRDLLK